MKNAVNGKYVHELLQQLALNFQSAEDEEKAQLGQLAQAILHNLGGEDIVVLSVNEAKRIANRLEYDASYDKVGEGYYNIINQLQEYEDHQ